MKESFVLYKSFYEPIKGLSSEDKGNLLDAIFQYQIEGFEPPNTSSIYMAFLFFKNQFRLDNEKYLSVVERNKSNGIKGGRPPKQETQTNPNNPVGFSEPKKADNDNDNDNEKENENKIENINKDLIVIKKDKPKFEAPTEDEFITYGLACIKKAKLQGDYEYALKAKYFAYSEANWRDGNNTPIKNWKTKLANVIQYMQPIKNDFNKSKPSQSKLESMANNAMEALNILNNGQ